MQISYDAVMQMTYSSKIFKSCTNPTGQTSCISMHSVNCKSFGYDLLFRRVEKEKFVHPQVITVAVTSHTQETDLEHVTLFIYFL